MAIQIISYKVEKMPDSRADVMFVKYRDAHNRHQCVVASVEDREFSNFEDKIFEVVRVGAPMPEEAFDKLIDKKVYSSK